LVGTKRTAGGWRDVIAAVVSDVYQFTMTTCPAGRRTLIYVIANMTIAAAAVVTSGACSSCVFDCMDGRLS